MRGKSDEQCEIYITRMLVLYIKYIRCFIDHTMKKRVIGKDLDVKKPNNILRGIQDVNDIDVYNIFKFMSLKEIVSLLVTDVTSWENNAYTTVLEKRLDGWKELRVDTMLRNPNVFDDVDKMIKNELSSILRILYKNLPSKNHKFMFDRFLYDTYDITAIALFSTPEYSDIDIVKSILQNKELQVIPNGSDELVPATDTLAFVNDDLRILYNTVLNDQCDFAKLFIEYGAIVRYDTFGQKLITAALLKQGEEFALLLMKNSNHRDRLKMKLKLNFGLSRKYFS